MLVRTRVLISGIVCIVTVSFLFSFLFYYPLSFRFPIIGCAFLWIGICFLKPMSGLFLLFAVLPLFGNHPGGRFMEIADFLLLTWLCGAYYNAKRADARILIFFKSIGGMLSGGFVFAGFLGLFFQPDIVRDWEHYRTNPFFFFRSGELEPMYPVKMILVTISIYLLFVLAGALNREKGGFRIPTVLFGGLLTGFSATFILGYLEFIFPKVSGWLDFYHIWLGGYVDRNVPHSVLPFRFSDDRSIQSLFWNRSWYAMYLIACLPFAALSLTAFIKKGRSAVFGYNISFLLISCLVFGFGFTLVLVGARGAILAFGVSIFCFLSISVLSLKKDGKFGRTLALRTTLVLLCLALLFPFLFAKGLGFLSGGEERKELFSAGILLSSYSPIFGGGMESYAWGNEHFLKGIDKGSRLHSSHNQFLQVLSGEGVFGLFFFCALWGTAIVRGIRFSIGNKGIVHRIILSSLLGIFAYSCVQEWFFLRAIQIPFWILILSITGKRRATAREFKFIVFLFCGLLVAALYLSGKKTSRFGTFFPPDRPGESYLLEGSGWMKISAPRKMILEADFPFLQEATNRKRILKLSNNDSEERVIHLEPRMKLEFSILPGELKWVCEVEDGPEIDERLNFFQRLLSKQVEDPEPRKICLKFSATP
ncbi:O-antigen ligase [Leptospira inadai serovar Lyme str. 10]|uniref:O-antigen ligase n=2 Tax=Leptospira inadai serovar Lyme TaxID=293084 RepID=V6HKQ8_9LEPT|nr:O-antigen ligase [Leptospira inadai serovar Lyme str. 10]